MVINAFPRTGPGEEVTLVFKIRCQCLEFMKMSNTTKLSTKFQISIPKEVRAQHKWRAGQTFALIPKGAGVLLAPVPDAEDLAGSAKGACAEGHRDHHDRY